jgi:hypothetical protein
MATVSPLDTTPGRPEFRRVDSRAQRIAVATASALILVIVGGMAALVWAGARQARQREQAIPGNVTKADIKAQSNAIAEHCENVGARGSYLVVQCTLSSRGRLTGPQIHAVVEHGRRVWVGCWLYDRSRSESDQAGLASTDCPSQ